MRRDNLDTESQPFSPPCTRSLASLEARLSLQEPRLEADDIVGHVRGDGCGARHLFLHRACAGGSAGSRSDLELVVRFVPLVAIAAHGRAGQPSAVKVHVLRDEVRHLREVAYSPVDSAARCERAQAARGVSRWACRDGYSAVHPRGMLGVIGSPCQNIIEGNRYGCLCHYFSLEFWTCRNTHFGNLGVSVVNHGD